MARSWYEVTNVLKGSADLYLYDQIGLFGVSAAQFVSEIKGLKGKILNVFVNSPGGDAFDGVAIYNALKRHEGTVNMTVDGIAASAASFIVQAGGNRTMATGSTMMIHEGHGMAIGGTSTMEKMAEELHLVNDNVASIYAERAGGTKEEWRERMAAESWYNADEAIAVNLADAAQEGGVKALAGRVFNLSTFRNVPENVEKANAANALTGIAITSNGNTTWAEMSSDWTLNDKLKPHMDALLHDFTGDTSADTNIHQADKPGEEPVSQSKEDLMTDEIRQALGLGDEGDVIAAINALKGAARDVATGEKGAENKLQRELSEARQRLLSQESEYGQRILALEDSNRQKEAEWAVDSAIQQGRVAPKDRDLALKLALNDSEGFAAFAANLRVDLNERGRQIDETMAAFEPTEAELHYGEQMGLTREQIMAQKAADLGVKLPA